MEHLNIMSHSLRASHPGYVQHRKHVLASFFMNRPFPSIRALRSRISIFPMEDVREGTSVCCHGDSYLLVLALLSLSASSPCCRHPPVTPEGVLTEMRPTRETVNQGGKEPRLPAGGLESCRWALSFSFSCCCFFFFFLKVHCVIFPRENNGQDAKK